MRKAPGFSCIVYSRESLPNPTNNSGNSCCGHTPLCTALTHASNFIASKVDGGQCLRLWPSGSAIHSVSLILTERKINLTFKKT